MTDDAPNGCINYGLSHGMAGPLFVLSLAHKKGLRKDGLEGAIEGLFDEFMKSSYHVDNIAYWPRRISFEQYAGLEDMQKTPGQMSWCYGSPGILRVLYTSSILMGRDDVAKFALDEFLKIAELDLANYALGQAIVCHGLVGTAAVLNLMYLETGKTAFLDKSSEMINMCSVIDINSYFELEKQRAQEINSQSRASLHNHLEGYSGILQTILSIIRSRPTGNDRRLLIC